MILQILSPSDRGSAMILQILGPSDLTSKRLLQILGPSDLTKNTSDARPLRFGLERIHQILEPSD